MKTFSKKVFALTKDSIPPSSSVNPRRINILAAACTSIKKNGKPGVKFAVY